MFATILDSEGVTLVELIEVEDSAQYLGIRLAHPPSRRYILREFNTTPTPLDGVRETRAVFERWRGDGVAIFRRRDA